MKKKDQERAERHIAALSKEISVKEFDYLCGQAAVRGSF